MDQGNESKTLTNTTAKQAKDQVPDLEIWGDGDMWKLICKASSKAEGWMKSTKAMDVPGIGCLVQVTTQQGENIAEALAFVPGGAVGQKTDEEGNPIARAIVPIDPMATQLNYTRAMLHIAMAKMPVPEPERPESKIEVVGGKSDD